MTDEIKKLQLAIWLAKSPGEQLNQFMIENEALYQFWDNVKPTGNPAPQITFDEPDNNHQ